MEARTLGQFVTQEGILDALHESVAEINARSATEAKAAGKKQKLTVSCMSCTAVKTCCHSMVVVRLYEGLLVAAHLIQEGRDTPELREELRARAEAMEAASPYEWRVPCLFLDGAERCTVYSSRPTSCGLLYVYTPPAWCSEAAKKVEAYVPHEETAAAFELEEQFRERLALRKKVGKRYIGVLPRMVLVALEAWNRSDFRDYLRQLEWPSEAEAARWSRRD